MKKSILFLATLLCTLAASAKVINAVPAGDISWYLGQAEDGDVIEMADGTYDEAYAITFSVENLTIKAAEGAKPVISLTGKWTSLILAATTTFEGITFDGGGVANYPITIEGENTGIFTFNNCEFKNYQYYAISNNNASTQTNVNSVVVNNCIFHDGGAAIYMNKEAACANLTVQNTTIYNFAGVDDGKAAIHIAEVTNDATFATQTFIDHVTIYNIQTRSDIGAITIVNASKTTISNCIIASPEQKWVDSYNVPAEATIQNCLVYNQHLDAEWTSTITNADPMFVDAANGNFQLYAESPAVGAGTDGSNLGDTRWGVKAGLKPGSEVLSKAVAAANDGDTIVLGDGEYIERWSYNYNKADLVVIAAEGAKPVIKANSYMKHYATTTFIGITFDGQNAAEYAIYSYENTEKDLTFINCELKNYTKYCITAGSSAHINKLLIDSCTIHDCGNAVYMPASGLENNVHTCSDFEMTNSTVYNIEGATNVGAIDIQANGEKDGNQNKVRIDHVTLYNFLTSGYEGGIKVYKSADAIISNCIVMNPAQKWANPYRLFTGAQIINSLYYNTEYVNNGATYEAPIYADPLFVDAANGNFKLSANSPAVGAGTNGSNLGDPRWGVSASLKGKVINVTPDQAGDLPWMIQNDASNVKAGDTIVMAGGTYELSSFEFRKEGLVVMAAKGEEVIIATKEGSYLKLVATTTFEGITFDGTNLAQYAIRSTDASAKNLTLRNCEFKNYLRYNVYGADGTHLDSLFVDNCLFHHSASAIYFPASTLADNVPGCSYAKITNSTFHDIIYNDYVATIDIQENNNAKETGNTELIVDHVTIYNFASTAKSAIKAYKSGKTTITNTIVANPNAPAPEETIYSFYIYGGAKVQNSLSFNAKGQWASNAYTDTIHADPLFVDAANGNFKLKGNSLAVYAGTDGTTLGDPRWGITPLELKGEGDDAKVLSNYNGKVADVKITRNFVTGDGYNTICLPFDMPANKIGNAYQIETINAYANDEIEVKFAPVTTLLAGQPYLIVPNKTELEEVKQVTITNQVGTTNTVSGGGVSIKMTGVLSENGTTSGLYWVGDQGWLYNGDVRKLGLRAYFEIDINTPSGIAPRMRVVTSENEATGLDNITTNEKATKAIVNGQLVIIRGGEMYNVQGQKL